LLVLDSGVPVAASSLPIVPGGPDIEDKSSPTTSVAETSSGPPKPPADLTGDALFLWQFENSQLNEWYNASIPSF
jgi:hypothetical protein